MRHIHTCCVRAALATPRPWVENPTCVVSHSSHLECDSSSSPWQNLRGPERVHRNLQRTSAHTHAHAHHTQTREHTHAHTHVDTHTHTHTHTHTRTLAHTQNALTGTQDKNCPPTSPGICAEASLDPPARARTVTASYLQWNEWSHTVVMIPETEESMRSRQTGHFGSSVSSSVQGTAPPLLSVGAAPGGTAPSTGPAHCFELTRNAARSPLPGQPHK